MKILFVVNSLYAKGNGLSASARRTMEQLRLRGHEVRALTANSQPDEQTSSDFLLKYYHLPVFDWLVRKQGYQFAGSDRKVMEEAVQWADVIHLEEPFVIQYRVVNIAKKLNKPCVGTYHLHPENLFSSVGLEHSRLLNHTLLRWWRDYVFNQCDVVQCPTQNVYDRLTAWKFKSPLRVISNGIPEALLTAALPRVQRNDGEYNIITIGRYSNEKNQITLLRAMKYSRYKDRIHLYLAGRGPIEKKLKRQADRLLANGVLKYPVSFQYYTAEELKQLYAMADLYIHCATVEVEGLGCTEAIMTGIVPVISRGELSATSQFALSEKSIYQERNPRDLAAKIDAWLDDDEARQQEALKYRGLGQNYALSKSIDQVEAMYMEAVRKHQNAET